MLYIVKGRRKISLINALKINKYTNGEVTLEEMIFKNEYKVLESIKPCEIKPKEELNDRKKIKL